MKKEKIVVVPVRLKEETANRMDEFRSKTGLNRSFVVRRCCDYALKKIIDGKIDILTLEERV